MKIAKIGLIALFVICCFTSYSQSEFTKNDKGFVEYSEVVEAPKFTKNDLFDNGLIWVSNNFKSAQNVIQYKDKEVGKIIVKGVFTEKGKWYWKFTLTMDFKENKYRFSLSEIYQDYNGDSYPFEDLAFPKSYKKMSLKRAKQIESDCINPLVNSLKTEIAKEAKDDW